jgi:hypothetical protein
MLLRPGADAGSLLGTYRQRFDHSAVRVPADGVRANAVGLNARAFGRHQAQVLKPAGFDHPAPDACKLDIQGLAAYGLIASCVCEQGR